MYKHAKTHKSENKSTQKLFSVFLAFLFVLLSVQFNKVNAGSLSLGISPPILQIEALPPASIKTPITVQNLGEETLELKAVLKPFRAKDTENGEVEYINDYPFIFQRMQIIDGLNVIDSLTLAPSQQKNLTLHIGLPKDEPAQDYYFSIVFISKDNIITDSNNSAASGGIATNVLLSVGPKGKAKGTVEEFSAPLFLEKGPVPFTVRVKNEGENVFAPTGKILIKNVFGQTIGKVDLLPVNILSNSIRSIPDSQQVISDKKKEIRNIGNLKLQKAFWREGFLLGPYTATLTLSLSDQGPQLSKSIYFFAFPIQGLIGLFAGLIIILFIRSRVKRHLN